MGKISVYRQKYIEVKGENIMFENLKKLNSEIPFYRITDKEFEKYGRVLDIDTKEVVSECKKIEKPQSGSQYMLSVESLENLNSSDKIRELVAGGCNAQIGLCWGYNNMMNAMEFHRSSEINIATTDLVLLLGLEYEMEGNEYSSDKIKAFYLKKGDAVEVYGTSLHFCPCQVSDDGFKCVVGLPAGTNDILDKKYNDDKLLFKKNKWIICHDENTALIEKGVYPGIHGKNYEIKY